MANTGRSFREGYREENILELTSCAFSIGANAFGLRARHNFTFIGPMEGSQFQRLLLGTLWIGRDGLQ